MQTILIIDDQPINLAVAVGNLEAYDFEVLTARDGAAGIRRARSTQPDLILLDIGMPGIDGFETCRRLKASSETAAIPVIFMTARTDAEAKVRGFEVGAVDYVTKPFETAELTARVQTHLELRALRLGLEQQVSTRTAELEQELAQGARHLRERDHLLAMVRLQSDQLREMTLQWIDDRGQRDTGIGEALHAQVTKRLRLVQMQLEQAQEMARGQSGELGACLRERLDEAAQLLQPAVDGSIELEGTLRTPADEARDNPLLSLSTREHEVLHLLVGGSSNKEIAALLDLARTTVSTYRMRILEKLGVDDVASLVRVVVEQRLVSPEVKPP